MAWPEATDYNEAIQNPALCFTDADLRAGRPEVNALGWPLPCSGNFAAVYKVFGPDGSPWAVKCFTRETPGLRERYQAVSAYLQQANLPFTIDFQYLEPGIRILGNWYPVVKMRWIDGFTLNEFLRQQLDRPTALNRLAQMWPKLARELRRAKIAHADLQHGNVILVLGAKTGMLSVRLIDYDGMFVPALADTRSGELGHANYQHPERARKSVYDVELDRFSHLVIYTALRAVAVGGRRLWAKYDNGENLLFREQDFLDPSNSSLLRELWQLGDPAVHALAGHVALACRGPISLVPLLSELLNAVEGPAPALSTAQEKEARALLGDGASPMRQPRVGILVDKPAVRSPEKQALTPPRPWYQQPSVFLGAAAAFLLLLAVIVWQLVGGGSSTDIPDTHQVEAVGTEPNRTQPKKGLDWGKGQSKAKAVKNDDAKANRKEDKKPPTAIPPETKNWADNDKRDGRKNVREIEVPANGPDEIPRVLPSPRVVAVGRFEPPTLPATTVLLQYDPKATQWVRLERQRGPTRVLTARPLVSLPGFSSVINTDKGVRLTLAGTLPEFFPGTPMLFESRVELHAHDTLDLDLTLRRGRIFLANTLDQPLRVRVRFENTTDPAAREMWDLTLQGKDAEVMIDCFGFFKPGLPFAVDPKDPKREGPITQVGLTVLGGSVHLRAGNSGYSLHAPPGPARMAWSSEKQGLSGPHKLTKLEPWARLSPAVPKDLPKGLEVQRVDMEHACKELSAALLGPSGKGGPRKQIDVGLVQLLGTPEAANRRLTVRCFAALDMASHLVGALADKEYPEVRLAAVQTLIHWIAASRDNEYKLYGDLRDRYSPVESEKIIWLLHGPLIGASRQAYGVLVDQLDSPRLAIRELAARQLFVAFPQAQEAIRFDATAPPEARQRVQAQWRRFLEKLLNGKDPKQGS